MSFKLSNTYLKLFIMTAAASAMLVGSECLHRLYFDIVPLGRPWEEFLYLLTFTSILCFSRWAFTKVCAAFFLFLCLIVNPVHFEVYQSWINGINYYLALAEWSEVANTGVSMIPKLIPTILWGLVDLLIVVLLYKYSQKIRQGKSRWPILGSSSKALSNFAPRELLSITQAKFLCKRLFRVLFEELPLDVLFVLLIAIVSVRSFDTCQEHGISPKTSYGKVKSNYFSFGYFLGRVLPYKVFNLSKITDYRSLAPTRLSDPKIDHIIFIVGESESAAHVGAFGYERNTTPFFSEIKGRDDFIVRPIHSAAFMTAVALPTLFNAIPQPNGMVQIMHGTTNLFRLAKDQGFQTYWFTAQARNEMNILNLIGGKWIDKITFPEAFGLSDRESMPDFNLLTQFDTVNFNTGRQFVILHQRGSHTPYGTLLSTEEVSVYGDSIVDHYDATILKTDKLIQTVYESIQKKGLKNWLLLYTSDHGAYVTNKTYNQGTVQRDSYTVPLFIASDNAEVMATYRKVFDNDLAAFHQQVSTSVIQLLGYDVKISDPQTATVNGNILTGDAGWLLYKDGTYQYVYP